MHQRGHSAVGRPVADVNIFSLQHRAGNGRNKRLSIVRWAVNGRQRSQSFRNSVETLVSTYVGALAGDEELANERIEEALVFFCTDRSQPVTR